MIYTTKPHDLSFQDDNDFQKLSLILTLFITLSSLDLMTFGSSDFLKLCDFVIFIYSKLNYKPSLQLKLKVKLTKLAATKFSMLQLNSQYHF